MSTGRRDYTWGFLNEAAVEGRFTESFTKYASGSIGAGAVLYLIDYVIPVGYRLTINRIEASTVSRVINRFGVFVDGVAIIYHYFSENYSFVFSDQNPLYVSAGKTLRVQCMNLDEVPYYFFGSVIGSLQQLTV